MNRVRSRARTSLVATLAVLAAGAGQAAAPGPYHVINLGFASSNGGLGDLNRAGQVFLFLGDGTSVRPALYDHGKLTPIPGATYSWHLSDRGEVVGMAEFGQADNTRLSGYRWSARTGIQELRGPAGLSGAEALAANDRGEVVGEAWNNDTPPGTPLVAVRWGVDGKPHGLTAPDRNATAYAVNDSGQVAGDYGSDLGDVPIAFVWSPTHGAVSLGTLGGDRSLFYAMNAAGQVVGSSDTGTQQHAFLWTPWRRMQDLGTLGGPGATAVDVNDAGEVTGDATRADLGTHAFYWRAGHGMRDIGTLAGLDSHATKINGRGVIVGYAELPDGSQHGFVWSEKHGMTDLNKLARVMPPGLQIGMAWSVNDSGAILADSNAGLVLLEPGCADGPVLGPLAVPAVVPLQTQVPVSARFADAAHGARYHARWIWGDGSPASEGQVDSAGHVAKASHAYQAPGTYQVVLRLSDGKGHTAATAVSMCVSADGSACVPGANAVARQDIRARTPGAGLRALRLKRAGAKGDIVPFLSPQRLQ